MDPAERVLFMPDHKRLTVQRVAGFAFEKAFKIIHSGGSFALTPASISSVRVSKVSLGRAGNSPIPSLSVVVSPSYQQAVVDAATNIACRLHGLGWAIVGVTVPQRGSTAHDLVLEHRKLGVPCRGQYSCELKLRTAPANREAMRRDCSRLFQAACGESHGWLGQIIVVAEMSDTAAFIVSKAELIRTGQNRADAVVLWGWEGRPCAAPSVVPPARVPAAPPALPAPVALQPQREPRRRYVVPRPWTEVWGAVSKHDATWTDEQTAVFKDWLKAAGMSHLVNHATRLIAKNREGPLRWRERQHYGRAARRAEGRQKQGGGATPFVVKRSALLAYHRTLCVA
jgi:hypothetical protein